jgi:hypothetical protein
MMAETDKNARLSPVVATSQVRFHPGKAGRLALRGVPKTIDRSRRVC